MPAEGAPHREPKLDDAFRYPAWDSTPALIGKINDLRLTIEQDFVRHPILLHELEAACTEGDHARQLATELVQRLQQNGESEQTNAWLESIQTTATARINWHLDIIRTKQRKRQSPGQRRQAQDAHTYTGSLGLIAVAPGAHHPNSLRHLPPSHHWHVLKRSIRRLVA